jgi:glucose/arabinose dehydrogenase
MLAIVLLAGLPLLHSQAAPIVPPADAASARLKVPQGFAVRLYATGLNGPRLLTVGVDGLLYVAEREAAQITRLEDKNGDGIAEAKTAAATQLKGVHNFEWFEGWLYAAEDSQITRLKDDDGDGTYETREKVVDLPAPERHTSRTLHFGPDKKLYVTAGSSTNIGPESDPRRAAILRFNPDGSIPDDNPYAKDADPLRRPVYAEGLRNAVDFLFTPDGKLWADHNGSDEISDDQPSEEIVIQIEKGKHYGWPYCYTPALGKVPANATDVHDPRVAFTDKLTNCSQSTPALFTDLAHSAPLGMVMYNYTGADAFPTGYAGNLFVAYHGSWNSSVPRDCRIQMITVVNGQPTASVPFLTGFRDQNATCGAAWGRPAGVAVGAKGELFVSDDANGNIYRIVYTSASQ